MFKKIMVPTDGSETSQAAAKEGIEFAKKNNGEVVAVYVAPEYQYPAYVGFVPMAYPVEKEYRSMMRRSAQEYLMPLQEVAEAAGVKFSSIVLFSSSAGVAISEAAEENSCDLIFMGSHGRTGLGQLILGSVTSKVLNMSQIPVLVHRMKK